jgi:hypothetical protein
MIPDIFYPVTTFLIILIIITILYLFAGTLGPKYTKAKYK